MKIKKIGEINTNIFSADVAGSFLIQDTNVIGLPHDGENFVRNVILREAVQGVRTYPSAKRSSFCAALWQPIATDTPWCPQKGHSVTEPRQSAVLCHWTPVPSGVLYGVICIYQAAFFRSGVVQTQVKKTYLFRGNTEYPENKCTSRTL